ncbi:FMN-dependent NADH-azoreductase 2 [gut metagenome]|uniref:FMN-dependent NADH-azoreductase 2 n=1 Tax=gut metagenome TaxID=749906 RepID=J9H3N8_9ZZZZ
MEKILFVHACVRPESRTMRLARRVLAHLRKQDEEAVVEEVNLVEENIPVIDRWEMLEHRASCLKDGQADAPALKYARQFAEADTVVVAAPYWDLAFPAMVKVYTEQITVTGLTFRYSEQGVPVGLCRARRLIYVMTAGGPIRANFGFDYWAALCRNFFGIEEVQLFKAENLDVVGNDVEAIMAAALDEVDRAFLR